MSDFKYILEKNSKKHICPACGKKRFVRYIDSSTGDYLPAQYGRCDREVNCSYHLNPFNDNYKSEKSDMNVSQFFPRKINGKASSGLAAIPKAVSFIPVEVFKQSRTSYRQNHFIKYLSSLFDTETVTRLIGLYHIGTSKHWPCATVFWQIDQQGNIRSGKIMLYNPDTGRRVKELYNHISWVHTALKLPDFNLNQCFFGEHLLNTDNSKPVAIVESEKTAVIASVYFPQFIWLAVGSLSNLSAERCKCLSYRKVLLFPDLNGFDKWSAKAKEISHSIPGLRFEVSDLLEQKAMESDKSKGLDLADFLIRFDYRKFLILEKLLEPVKVVKNVVTPPHTNISNTTLDKVNNNKVSNFTPSLSKETWDITELENFFKNTPLPSPSVKLNPWSTIIDISLFIDSHLEVVKTYNGIPNYKPYFNRLLELKKILLLNLN